jgi:D-alanyl-D-alanine carboxypeptidase/D-alanyl-D-alanine-endopeptidase (penicillin-binding protein 4)
LRLIINIVLRVASGLKERPESRKNTRELIQFPVKGSSIFGIFLAKSSAALMKKYLISTTSLILLIFWPTLAQELTPSQGVAAERVKTVSEERYLQELATFGRNLEAQGLYIESLDGTTVLADHQSKVPFNPASVIKIATSFAALDKLGADYHFETAFEADGEIDKKTRTLDGDLVLQAVGDPLLTTTDVNKMVRQVVAAGVAKVTGSLVVTGPFTYQAYLTTADAVKRLESALKVQGIRIAKPTRRASGSGTVLASHLEPRSLRDIVFEQNARSVNQTAERLGEAIGGPKGVKEFLVRGVGIPKDDVHITRTSGLEYNRITARGTVQLLRHLVLWLNFKNMLPQDVLPIAGEDYGTLRGRFTTTDYRGSIIGKTGTLPMTDGGVSALAGFMYTRDRGVLLFAIFNTQGNVNTFRRLQDGLLKDLFAECGGAQLSASLRKSSN